jgi:transcriptional regulator with XRE-family HTH domain
MDDYLPVSQQLSILFEAVKKDDGQSYTLVEVSQASDVSVPTLSQLRHGKITNPQLNTVRAICHFFNVPIRYFNTKSVDECYAILNSKREDEDNKPGLHQIAYMAAILSPESQRDLMTIIQWAQAAERDYLAGKDLPVPPHLGN